MRTIETDVAVIGAGTRIARFARKVVFEDADSDRRCDRRRVRVTLAPSVDEARLGEQQVVWDGYWKELPYELEAEGCAVTSPDD